MLDGTYEIALVYFGVGLKMDTSPGVDTDWIAFWVCWGLSTYMHTCTYTHTYIHTPTCSLIITIIHPLEVVLSIEVVVWV